MLSSAVFLLVRDIKNNSYLCLKNRLSSMLPLINKVSLFLKCEPHARLYQTFLKKFLWPLSEENREKFYRILQKFSSSTFTVSKSYLLRFYESTRISSNRNILLSESRVFFFIDCN